MDLPHRILQVDAVPVYLPADLGGQFNTTVESLLQPLIQGNFYGCVELADQSYPVQEVIWSTLLSFIAFKRKAAVQGALPLAPHFRLIYVCSGFHTMRMHVKLLNRLKNRMQVPEFDEIKTTAFGEPVNQCINRKIQQKHKNSRDFETNIACRATVRCKRCPYYNNVYDASVKKPEIPNFLPDVEDFSARLDETNICPYYNALSRMDTAHLIVTTYDVLKATLSESDTDIQTNRLPQENLLLDKDTFLLCDDPFAMEKMFEDCYNLTVGVASLKRVIVFCLQRRRNLWQIQQSILPFPIEPKQRFYDLLRVFCEILDKLSHVLTGEIVYSPETPEGRLKLLADVGLSKIEPKFLHEILVVLQTDFFDVLNVWPKNFSVLNQDISNVQQLFTNLINPDVTELLFPPKINKTEKNKTEKNKTELNKIEINKIKINKIEINKTEMNQIEINKMEINYFRFWVENISENVSENNELNLATLSFNFFGVSVNPVLMALRRRGVASCFCFGTMVPVSFASVDPKVAFCIRRLSYSEVLNPVPTTPLFSGIFAFGPNDVPFNCDAVQREQPRYILALGKAIRRILEIIPEKILLLFPSMTFFESCCAVWKADETLRHFFDQLQTVFSCGFFSCSKCSKKTIFYQKNSQFLVTFARSGSLDGATVGFQTCLIVSLPFQFFLDKKIAAKKAFLKNFKTAAFDFYAQEAINAMAAPFIKTSCLDCLSTRRGRIFIVLDSRVQKYVRFLPTFVSQGTKVFTTFEEGITKLTHFLKNIPDWDVSQDGDLLDPEVFSHVRQLHKSVLADLIKGNRTEIIEKLFGFLENFKIDENVDLLASGILETIQIEKQYESSEFVVYFLPWLFGFRQFFRKSQWQKYWPVVIQNLLQQIGDRIFDAEKSRLTFTLPADCDFVYERCHVQ